MASGRLLPARRPARVGRTKARSGANEPEAFYRGEPIAIDLTFGPPASVRGKIVDDRGRPLAGVKVQVGACDAGRSGQKMWSCHRVDPTDAISEERRAFNGIHALPEALLSTRTGPDGSYRIDGLPREAQFLSLIDPGPEYDTFSDTIATTAAPIRNVQSLGHDAVLNRTFRSPRKVSLSVRFTDTKQPARDATIRARATGDHAMIRAGGVGVTDADGRTTLHLLPGPYEIAIEPPAGTPYLPGHVSFAASGEADGTSLAAVELEPAAIVSMEARDARTGAGIDGVRFQYETDSSRLHRELHSQLVVVDHPETDEQGRLRAIVEPGRKRFFVERIPPGWKLDGSPGRPVILVAGRETTIRWSFTRVDEPKPVAGSGPALFPDDLVEEWRRQDRRALPGKFRVRHYMYYLGRDSIATDEFEAFLDANDLSKSPDPAAALEDRFPQLPEESVASYEIIDDGRHRRNTYRYSAPPGFTGIAVSNGLEVVDYESANGQSNIYGPNSGATHEMFGLRDICARPWMLARVRGRNQALGKVRRAESGGRLTVEEETAEYTARWVVDRQTGFVYADSLRMTPGGVNDQVIRQYGPRIYRDGVVLPTVHVRKTMYAIVLDIIDEVELDYRPTPRDFAVAAPAGTVIVDYREGRSHPRQGMNRYPVADVIAYADGLSPRNRSIEPVLKVGGPAPPIEPASWLDRNGATGPPDVAGKVVLVDFWGISCGFCLVELPEVQAAADHFADRKDLVFIGLHESGATAGQVAEFARKRGLTYQLAVDRPIDEEGWFGATFKDYGVRGIPAAAVIDRKGNVAFVGRFPEALAEAAKLLGQSE